MILSHCHFINRLIYNAEQYKKKVHIVIEEYTSQTCGNCGILKKDLMANKIYKCKQCKIIIDIYMWSKK